MTTDDESPVRQSEIDPRAAYIKPADAKETVCYECDGPLNGPYCPACASKALAWQEPPLTCPHIDKVISSGEASPQVVEELFSIRDINSQLRYGTWALKARAESAEAKLAEAVKVMEQIATAPAWGAPERWETTPAEVRQLARKTLRKIEGDAQ